jgi:hypothetical protein
MGLLATLQLVQLRLQLPKLTRFICDVLLSLTRVVRTNAAFLALAALLNRIQLIL